MMNEDMEQDTFNPDLDNGAEVAVEPVVEEQPVQAVNEVDWKAEAIAAQTRLQVIEQMRQEQLAQQQQNVPQQVDEVTRLRRAIQEKRAAMPALDDKNPQTFWDRERIKEDIDALNERLVEARIRQQERLLVGQQVDTSVQQYKLQQSSRPAFKAIEAQFDHLVSRLEPHLRGNRTMLEMVRKNLEYDYMSKTGAQPKAPSAPASSAYQPQAKANANKGKVNWRSDADRNIGEYYIQRGIISGPEEYYDPKFNERSSQANNNGVAIYDVPNKPRGWRR